MKLSHAAPPPPLGPHVARLSPACCGGSRGRRAPAGFCFRESLEHALESSASLVNTQMPVPPDFSILQPGVGSRTRVSRTFSRRWPRAPRGTNAPRRPAGRRCWRVLANERPGTAPWPLWVLTCPRCVPHRSPPIPPAADACAGTEPAWGARDSGDSSGRRCSKCGRGAGRCLRLARDESLLKENQRQNQILGLHGMTRCLRSEKSGTACPRPARGPAHKLPFA